MLWYKILYVHAYFLICNHNKLAMHVAIYFQNNMYCLPPRIYKVVTLALVWNTDVAEY